MLAELEQRLAGVLGNQLPAPFTGRVTVAPARATGAGPAVLVGVRQASPLEPDFGATRVEPVPSPPDRQRVVRMGVEIGITIEPQQASNRDQVMAGIDALVYLLDDKPFRTAEALAEPGDPGFVLESLALKDVRPVLRTDPADPPQVLLSAEGFFWPVGTVGEAGAPIVEARLRQIELPMSLVGAPARIPAGGEAVALRFSIGAAGTMRVLDGGSETAGFGPVAVRLVGEAGGPGAGALSGGEAGPDGARLLTLSEGEASVFYTPPPAAAVDRVVVHWLRGEGAGASLGLETARFTLSVEAGA